MATSKLADLSEALPLLDLDTDPLSATYNQYAKGRNTARDFRMDLLAALFGALNTGMPIPGILGSFWLGDAATGYYAAFRPTAQGTPSRVITFGSGRAIVGRSGQAGYLATQESDLSPTLPAADGSLARIDRVGLMVYDKGAIPADPDHGPQLLCITGTPASSPVAPAYLTDMIPIAKFARAAGAAGDQISQANITDERKSTALFRALRALLPGDLLTDPGYYHGEQRQRTGNNLVPTGLAQSFLIDTWSSHDSKWHGTKPISLSAAINAATPNILNNAQYVAQSITIPDPGYEYYIEGNASCVVTGVPTNSAYSVQLQVRVDAVVTASGASADVVTHGLCEATSPGGSGVVGPLGGRGTQKWSGAHTVNAIIRNVTGSTLVYGGSSPHNFLNIRIVPA